MLDEPGWPADRLRAGFLLLLQAFVEGIDMLTRFGGIFTVRILVHDIVVINPRPLPFPAAFVISRNLETPTGLLRLERVDFLLRFGHTLLLRMQRVEIRKRGNGLRRHA